VATVEHLIGLMAKHDLSLIRLREGHQQIELRKGGGLPMLVPAAMPAAAPAPAAPAPTPAVPPPAPAAAGPAKLEIKSEMVGTFYSRPNPDKPDYVSVGSKVAPNTVVCTVEAMKIFNEVTAGVAGTVAEACVANGEFVEFGTVLFRVDPS
jgi:acetyl-CoA carboxylase biotin carboxyl carrier protein